MRKLVMEFYEQVGGGAVPSFSYLVELNADGNRVAQISGAPPKFEDMAKSGRMEREALQAIAERIKAHLEKPHLGWITVLPHPEIPIKALTTSI